jgi:L-aspartate oxidase
MTKEERMNRVKTDVLIIGAGAAGCVTALAAAEGGAEVTLILNSSDFLDSNTGQAQGGIIYRGKSDSPALLAKDILAAGAGKCDPRAVRWLARRGPALVKKLLIDRLNVPFDRDAKGNLDITREAAHSIARIVHTEDLTGRAIEQSLYDAIQRAPSIRVIRGATAVELLTLSHHSRIPTDVYEPPTCIGAYVLLQNEKRVVPFLAKETVLATGGLGQLYLHTTNPKRARGDGIAMAYRAGARLINLEYVQFHPTALYHPGAERFLISESVRGEGGRLVRKNGSTFMERYHAKGSLAPRDVVARAIHDVMLEHDEPCVYLDITHKKPEWTKKRFPNIFKRCRELGIDITREPIPVVPAAHYACGGVAVDLHGRSSIRRLRAIGEVSCTGLHGANRLASTSLLEAMLWGWTAGADIAQNLKREHYYFPAIADWAHEKEQVDPALILQDWLTIKYTMWNYVGLVRSTRRMKRARQILRVLQLEIGDFYEKAKLTDELLGLRNGVQTALAVLFAAMENHESRGCHYRID